MTGNQITVNVITVIVAVVGAVLGIINTCYVLRRDKIKLRVSPINIVDSSSKRTPFGIKITNLSTFPVVVIDVGFILGKKQKFSICESGKSYPLDTRGVVTVEYQQSINSFLSFLAESQSHPVEKVYAETECGETHYGTNKALRDYIKEIRRDWEQIEREAKERGVQV